MALINQLCDLLRDIWANGKILYSITNKTKTKDYANSQLVNRIRQEELKTKVAGVASDIKGYGLNKVKVVAKPVLGGRTKTVYSDANGNYELKGLKPEPYNLTFTLDGKLPMMVQTEPVTNETVTVNVQMVNL